MEQSAARPFREIRHSGAFFRETLHLSTPPPECFLALHSFGESLFHRGARVPLCSPEWVFQRITGGRGIFATPDERFPLTPGAVCLMHPRIKYQILVSREECLRKEFIGISNNVVSSGIMTLAGLSGKTFFPPAAAEAFRNYFQAVKGKILENAPETHSLLSGLSYRFLEQLSLSEKASAGQKPLGRLLHGDLFEPNRRYTVESLARTLGTSKRTLNRLFQKHFQCPPLEFLIRRRMEYAKQLLAINTLFVQDVARECGYSSPPLFIQEFRRRFGMTPRRYRLQKLGGERK